MYITHSNALTPALYYLPLSPLHPSFFPTNDLLTPTAFLFCLCLSGFDKNHLCGFEIELSISV